MPAASASGHHWPQHRICQSSLHSYDHIKRNNYNVIIILLIEQKLIAGTDVDLGSDMSSRWRWVPGCQVDGRDRMRPRGIRLAPSLQQAVQGLSMSTQHCEMHGRGLERLEIDHRRNTIQNSFKIEWKPASQTAK